MRYRNPKKDSDLFSMIEHQQSVLKTVKGSRGHPLSEEERATNSSGAGYGCAASMSSGG